MVLVFLSGSRIDEILNGYGFQAAAKPAFVFGLS
jgi:hypothetical protein